MHFRERMVPKMLEMLENVDPSYRGQKSLSGEISRFHRTKLEVLTIEFLGTRFFQVTFLGVVSDLFEVLSDLHLCDQWVTWKRLV